MALESGNTGREYSGCLSWQSATFWTQQ